MSKYEVNEEECCHCCGIEDIPVSKFTYSNFHPQNGEDYWLCEICSQTHFSNVINWPEQCSDPALYRSIAAGLSIILREIRKGK